MSDNKILEKLKRLYQLAILRDEEKDNESRQNEARTSAFLLLKIARENGVKIKFEVPSQRDSSPIQGVPFDSLDINDLFRSMMNDIQQKRSERSGRRTVDDIPFRAPPPRGRRPPSSGWPATPYPGSSFETPRRSPFSKHPAVIIEVRVNSPRRCAVCEQAIFKGDMAWMIGGFGFAHTQIRSPSDPCTCDEGLAKKFDERRRKAE